MLCAQLSAAQLHPLFFRLFRCQDKGLRQLLFRHIVAGGATGPVAGMQSLRYVSSCSTAGVLFTIAGMLFTDVLFIS